MIPKHLRLLFWDANVDNFDPGTYPLYAIERVLEYGEAPAVAWLRETFSEQQIREVIRTDRRLTPLSANFWALVFGIPTAEVTALRSAQ